MADFFADAVSGCAIRINPAARDQAGLVCELIAWAVDHGVLPRERQQDAIETVLRREQIDATVLPDGISFPHGRLEGLDRTRVVLGINGNGLDLGAPDGQPTYFTLLMLVPADAGNSYVQILARFSRKMMDSAMRARLLATTSEADARNLLLFS